MNQHNKIHFKSLQQLNQVSIITGMHVEDNKLVIITKPKTIHFDLSKDVDNSLKYETDFIIKHIKLLAEHTIKTKLANYCSNISMEMIFMNTKNINTKD